MCHWPITEPLVLRDCSSFEAGKAGCEAWAARHVGRLRAEIARGGRIHPEPRGDTSINPPVQPVQSGPDSTAFHGT